MNKKIRGGIVSILLVFTLLVSGCSIGGTDVVITSGVGNRDVFKIGGVSYSTKVARVYLANYQNIYGNSYGINLWEHGFQTEKLKTYIKEVALSEMTQIVCMSLLAESQKISLTEAELELAKGAAKKYFDSLKPEEKEYMGVSEGDIRKMYEDYALAQKVYQALTKSVNEEVSDDEARIMEAMQIFVKTEDKADLVAQKLSAGEDFATLASNYNQKANIELTFGRGDMPQSVEEIAFELDDNGISGSIPVEDGFYFIKCINKFNEELTDANKVNIVEAREKAAFDDVYEKFVSGLASNLNERVWNDIELKIDGTIQTNSFFKVIEEAIGQGK